MKIRSFFPDRTFPWRCLLLLFPLCLGAAAVPEGMAKIENLTTAERCQTALKTEKDPVVRRCAFRKLVYTPATSEKAIQAGLTDKDPSIRALALYEHFMKYGEAKTLPLMKKMSSDKTEAVGKTIAELAQGLRSTEDRTPLLQNLVKNGATAEVRQAASRGIGYQFYRTDHKPLSEDPSNDHDVTCLKKVPIPVDGWAFSPDKCVVGHLGKNAWYTKNFNDSAWKRIRVDREWESQGFAGYDGVGWYRKKFTVPAEPKGNVYEICFGAVDENAYVWLNGTYIGQHAIGPKGWDIPFRLDVTKELIRGGENLLVVRVEDSEMAGGIWKPVHIEIMKAIQN